MATIADRTPQQQVQVLEENRRTLAFGLAWGGLALVIFSIWTATKGRPFGLALALFILAGVSLFTAAYHLFSGRGQGPEQRLAKFHSDRRFFAFVLIGEGILLALIGLWLGFGFGLGALGESIGLILVAAIAIGAGCWQRAGQTGTLPGMHMLAAKEKPLGIGLIIGGAVLVLTGVLLKAKFEAAFPQWGGALLVGFVAAATGLYLFVATQINSRLVVLVAGGLIGLIIAVMAFAQAWVWREVFFGGLSRWRGPDAWQLWLCAYLELIGLALMFGSLLLARADVRSQAGLRLALYGYNSIFTGMLLLAFLVILNIMVYVMYPLNFDWTASRGLYALSDSSQDILQKLDKQVTVYVLLAPQSKVYKDIHNLLDNAQSVTDKLTVEYISPDQDFRKYDTLAQKYPELLPDVRAAQDEDEVGRGILVVYGPDEKGQKPLRALIGPRKILEVKREAQGERALPKLQFKGESALMTEIQFFMEKQKKSRIYFLQDDGELDVAAGDPLIRRVPWLELKMLGAAKLVDRLQKENFEVRGLSFQPGKDEGIIMHLSQDKDKPKEIPADARAVIVAGPSAPLSKEALDALERYLNKDGKLLVLYDVVVNRDYTAMKKTPGLDELLKKHNVEVTDEYVMRLPLSQFSDPLKVLATVPMTSESTLAKKFRGEPFRFKTARIIRPLTQASKFQADVLLDVVPSEDQAVIWAEKNVEAMKDPVTFSIRAYEGRRREPSQKPLPVAVTVREGDKPRLIVFGDAEFVSNAGLFDRQGEISLGDRNFNFLASSLDWLADRPGVGAKPKETGVYVLGPKAQEESGRMVLVPGWLMMVGILGLGMGLWVVRRR